MWFLRVTRLGIFLTPYYSSAVGLPLRSSLSFFPFSCILIFLFILLLLRVLEVDVHVHIWPHFYRYTVPTTNSVFSFSYDFFLVIYVVVIFRCFGDGRLDILLTPFYSWTEPFCSLFLLLYLIFLVIYIIVIITCFEGRRIGVILTPLTLERSLPWALSFPFLIYSNFYYIYRRYYYMFRRWAFKYILSPKSLLFIFLCFRQQSVYVRRISNFRNIQKEELHALFD